MTEPTTAKLSLEIELALTGVYQRGYAATGPTYSSGGEPGEPDTMEDVEITDIGMLKLRMHPGRVAGQADYRYDTLPLTDGVDIRNEHVQHLLWNLLGLIHEEAELALLDEARSW